MTIHKSAARRGSMVRNFIHLGLGQATTTILTILLSYVLARVLSLSEFGLMFLLTSIATFAYVVIDWGHGPLLVREIARRPDATGSLFGSAIAVRTAGAILACPIVI